MTEASIGEELVRVDGPDEVEPVELEETSEAEAQEPPEDWGEELTSDDWDERFTGVLIEPGPEEVGA